MTTKRLAHASFASAVCIQAAFVAGYGLMTDWSFGATLTAQTPLPTPRFIVWFVNSAILVQRLGWGFQVGDLTSTLVSALVNSVAWTILLFVLLYVLTRPSRAAAEPTVAVDGGR